MKIELRLADGSLIPESRGHYMLRVVASQLMDYDLMILYVEMVSLEVK